ncbi:MAG: hypothetical protein ACP5JG_15610 [Anaerolineae bacterium]
MNSLPENSSALQTKIGVKFVVNGILHEEAYEGSCRHGDLKELTYEAEQQQLDEALARHKRAIAAHAFPPPVFVLDPVTTHLYVEKGNPDIMLTADQLQQLAEDDPQTDVYVVLGGGLPQYTALAIAERYRKPVVLLNASGWAVDAPAGIRAQGLEGYYVQNWQQLDQILRVVAARKMVQRTRILGVTNFPDRAPRGVISAITDFNKLRTAYGIGYQNMNYRSFFGMMDELVDDPAVQDEAGAIADKLIDAATRNAMTRDDIVNTVLFYLAAKNVMAAYDCNAFMIECFELCSSMIPWERRFTPCLTHALLKDGGYPSACEHDASALFAMMVEMYLSRKAVYMGNPDVDIDANTLTIHHSVASLKLTGIEGPDTPFGIENFTQDGFGVTLRHDFNQDKGEAVTVARFDPTGTKLLVTSGIIVSGGGLEGQGCAQSVTCSIADGKGFLREQQNFGHHLALVLGDYMDDITLLGELMGFDVIVA